MRFSRAALVLVVVPAALAAQQPAPSKDPITAVVKQRTMAYQQRLAQAFDSIPDRLMGYKPTPAQLTIGYIAQHLASDNYLFCNQFGPMKGTISAADSATADSVKAKWPKDSLVTKLKASFAFCESAFAQLNDTNLADPVTLTFGNNSRQVSRATMVLGHALDLADHYSQIANYMRLNNMLPPSALPRPRPAGQ